MTVDDVVRACLSMRRGPLDRDRALRQLVQQRRNEGMTYEAAVAAVSAETRDGLLRAGCTEDQVRGLGVSVAAIRLAVERPRE